MAANASQEQTDEKVNALRMGDRAVTNAQKICELLKELEEANRDPELRSRNNISRGIRRELRRLRHNGGLLRGKWRAILNC